jgi:hypothetical protein
MAVPVHAQITQLTFDGIGDDQVIGNYYNGGPGGALGVTFGGTALSIVQAQAGGSGNFQGNPSGTTIMFWLDANPYMDVASGFTGGFSLYYSAIGAPGSVDIFSGFAGTGTLLASLSLPVTPQGPYGSPPCDGTGSFCPWVATGTTFAGTAESVVFGGAANGIGFDNVTFGSDNAATVTASPEPASLALVATGLVGLVGVAGRRRNRKAESI